MQTEANLLNDIQRETDRRIAIANARPCKWIYSGNDGDDYWIPDCDQAEAFCFLGGGPVESHFHFCPFCGKSIEVVEPEPDAADDDADDDAELHPCQCGCGCKQEATVAFYTVPVCENCRDIAQFTDEHSGVPG